MGFEDLPAFITALAALGTAVYGFWKVSKDSKAQQSAESATSVSEHMKRQDESIEKLEKRQDASVVRERLMGDYVFQLRQHIAEGKPPPPPAWPDQLLYTQSPNDK